MYGPVAAGVVVDDALSRDWLEVRACEDLRNVCVAPFERLDLKEGVR